MKFVFTLVLSLTASLFMQAQTKEEAEYRLESEKVRKEVWGWTDPKFKVREIPEAFATASKVIIAHHVELNAERKSNLGFAGSGFGRKVNQEVSEIVRDVIKLNDKNAIADYSELSFTSFISTVGFAYKDVSTTMIGIRVIKPDGTVREIDADDIVLTKNDNKSKKAKLAVPDLQPGDIIDFYIATLAKSLNDFSKKEYLLRLFDDAPIMNYSFHAELNSKYWVDYRCYNGAPELKLSTNKEKDNIFDVSQTNIPAFETNLWVAAARQLPYIRISLVQDQLSKKAGKIDRFTDNKEAIQGLNNKVHSGYVAINVDSRIKKEFKKQVSEAEDAAKRTGKDYKKMDISEKAAQQFYAYRFYKILPSETANISKFIDLPRVEMSEVSIPLNIVFDLAELKPLVIGSEYRMGYRFKEAMKRDDLLLTAYIPSINKFFSIESIFDLPFETPSSIEGATETTGFYHDRYVKELPGPKVAISKSTDNARLEKYNLTLIPGQNELRAQRNATIKGYYKLDIQRQLVLYEDYYEQERLAMGEKKSLLESVEDNKNGKQLALEFRNAFAEERKRQQEAFLQDVKEWLGLEINDMKETRIQSMGVRHTSPDLIYSSSFTINGMVKKAGNNYIIEIGKILGEPLKVKEDQRKRSLDVYMPFARSIEYEVTIDIPEGYTAEGIKALNVDVKNETGFFTAEAMASEKQVTFKIKKHYLNNFEPAANFGKLNEFMDASSAWTDSKLLLRKQ